MKQARSLRPAKWLRPLCMGMCALQAAPTIAETASASRVTPSTIVPQYRQTQPDTVDRAVPPSVTVPDNADKLTIVIKTLAVIDGYPAVADLVRAEAARVEGHRVSVRELYETAARIEAIYTRNGYFLARATVPAQRIEDGGTFTIQIVQGFIESLEINGLDSSTKELVEQRLHHLIGANDIVFDQLERQMLLAGDIPGLTLKSALARGEKAGGVRLIVQGALKPVSVTVGFDNNVADGFSGRQFWTQALLSNLLGQGELIYGSAFNGPDLEELVGAYPERRVLALGAIIPIGNNGLSINPEYVTASIHPREQVGILITTGHFARASVKLSYPLIRSRTRNLILTGAFEAVEENQIADMFFTKLSEDRLRVASLAVDWAAQLPGRVNIISHSAVTQGITAFGARTIADVTTTGIGFSRSGSQPDYAKANTDIRLRHLSRGGTDFTITFRGQQSLTGALPSYGQFSLDGSEGLSAFAPGTLTVDSGLTLRGEIGRRFVQSKFEISPYLFGAFGVGTIARPTNLENADVGGGSFGVGFQSTLFKEESGATVLATAELSHGASNIVNGGQNRVSFALSARF